MRGDGMQAKLLEFCPLGGVIIAYAPHDNEERHREDTIPEEVFHGPLKCNSDADPESSIIDAK